MGVGVVLQRTGIGSTSFWFGYMGDEPLHGPSLRGGGGAAQGGQTDYREAALGSPGRKLGVPSIGGGYAGGRV